MYSAIFHLRRRNLDAFYKEWNVTPVQQYANIQDTVTIHTVVWYITYYNKLTRCLPHGIIDEVLTLIYLQSTSCDRLIFYNSCNYPQIICSCAFINKSFVRVPFRSHCPYIAKNTMLWPNTYCHRQELDQIETREFATLGVPLNTPIPVYDAYDNDWGCSAFGVGYMIGLVLSKNHRTDSKISTV